MNRHSERLWYKWRKRVPVGGALRHQFTARHVRLWPRAAVHRVSCAPRAERGRSPLAHAQWVSGSDPGLGSAGKVRSGIWKSVCLLKMLRVLYISIYVESLEWGADDSGSLFSLREHRLLPHLGREAEILSFRALSRGAFHTADGSFASHGGKRPCEQMSGTQNAGHETRASRSADRASCPALSGSQKTQKRSLGHSLGVEKILTLTNVR